MNVSIKRHKSKLINSNLELKNRNFNFISQIYKINIKTKKIKNKISNNEKNKDTNKEKIKSFYRILDFIDIIILLLISNILCLSYQNSIVYGESVVTLKVSGDGDQNIFYYGTQFTKPDEVWIDELKQDNVEYHYTIYTTNIITLKWTNEIEGCVSMFRECTTISEINFIYFDAKKCDNTNKMFCNCISLTSLNLLGFITSSRLNSMADMFKNCKSLISLNLSYFDISGVENFGHMLLGCESLQMFECSMVKTEKTKYLDYMFSGCKLLTSVNLSNLGTDNLETINNMFEGCGSLEIIDFPNLDITKVNEENLGNVFLNCSNLEYININNFKYNNYVNLFFNEISNNPFFCIHDAELIEEMAESKHFILKSYKGNFPDYEYKINEENKCFTEYCMSKDYKFAFKHSCIEECPSNSKPRDESIEK